ncbi:MAG: caspase family protein [Blastocatellia bacterium]
MNFRSPHKQSIPLRISALSAVAAPLLALSLTAAQTQDRGQSVRKPVDKLPGAAKRWALIVGVDDYESSEINDLGGAANDAKALKDALVRYAGFPKEQVILLASDQPDQRKPKYPLIIKYLTNLKGLVPPDGLLLFAFSGHGVERGGRTYLLPADAQSSENIRLLERTALPVDEVKEEIRATGVQQVLIVLDSCRNDPAPGKGGGDNRLTDSFIRSFNFDLRNSEIDAFVTLHAASSGQRAYEYAEKRQGYFTWTLIEALRGGAANERGEVTLAGLLAYLEKNVPIYVRRIRLRKRMARNHCFHADRSISGQAITNDP